MPRGRAPCVCMLLITNLICLPTLVCCSGPVASCLLLLLWVAVTCVSKSFDAMERAVLEEMVNETFFCCRGADRASKERRHKEASLRYHTPMHCCRMLICYTCFCVTCGRVLYPSVPPASLAHLTNKIPRNSPQCPQKAGVYSPASDLPHRTVIFMCQDKSGHRPTPIPVRQITASSMVPHTRIVRGSELKEQVKQIHCHSCRVPAALLYGDVTIGPLLAG